jgi:hypothetical protein
MKVPGAYVSKRSNFQLLQVWSGDSWRVIVFQLPSMTAVFWEAEP